MQRHNEETLEQIRIDFVQGIQTDNERKYPTIEELSKQYNIPAVTLYRKSQAEEWKTQRSDFKSNLQSEINKQKKDKLAKEAVAFDENNLRIAKALQNEIVAQITISTKIRQDNERPFFTPQALNSLAQALSTCQRVGRLAVGESTENTNITNDSTITEAFNLIEQICRPSNSEGKSELH